MGQSFQEIKLFQVKPDKLEDFEKLVSVIAEEQRLQPGAKNINYMKRFYTIDGVDMGQPPREIARIVKCVKYYSVWEFEDIVSYGKANEWFFSKYSKDISKLLIMPFDIHLGYVVI